MSITKVRSPIITREKMRMMLAILGILLEATAAMDKAIAARNKSLRNKYKIWLARLKNQILQSFPRTIQVYKDKINIKAKEHSKANKSTMRKMNSKIYWNKRNH